MFDFVRAKDYGGPEDIFRQLGSNVKKGNRLFGFAGATCPDCADTRQIWIYIDYQVNGWYAPLPKDQLGKLNYFLQNIRIIAANPSAIDNLVAPSLRQPIKDSLY